MINVLHYAPGFITGGIESRLIDWYENMDHSLIRFHLIKLNEINDTYNIKRFEELGGIVHNLPCLTIKNFKSYLSQLDRIFSENTINIIHVHDISSGIFALKIAKKHNISCRILHSRTSSFLPDEKNLLIKKFLKRFAPYYATEYFACSQIAGEWTFGNKYKFSIIKNGVILDKYKFDDNIRKKIRNALQVKNEFVIGTISRLSTQKNIFFLLNVFYLFHKTNGDSKLVIIGDGPVYEEIKKWIYQKGMQESIILLGYKSNVYEYYMGFDMFISTSLYEGFGTTALEAQATGLPTILSTGFPHSVEISNYVTRISLQEDYEKWIYSINHLIAPKDRQLGIEYIKKSGYDAVEISKQLQEFYIKKCN